MTADPPRFVESRRIGPETSIGAFTHIRPDAQVGNLCVIGDHVTIGNHVVIANRVVVGDGARLHGAVEIGDDVVIGANAAVADGERAAEKTVIERGARIGAGAIVLAGHTVARGAVVEPGAVVTHNVPPNAIVAGHPARILGYIGAGSEPSASRPTGHRADGARLPTHVRGVEVVELPVISDLHGQLTVGEIGRGLPFQPKRFFVVYDVPSREVRGEHAHRSLHQLLICIRGVCTIAVDDGRHREEYRLDSPSLGLHIAPMVWASQSGFSQDATLLVLASQQYDAEDYIRDYDEFVAALNASKG